eukprot:CAMPEP_0205819096 /NCGR_PEP_ID=MMETSP0206-20130828/1304_1 /ASSEMBLY_ACC=CAM_ASM_000279 /TAXON_ID=36767 /ORGANISM="Euplotes focardii, Strain TN1" /LENGTH=212 /DNA_ID=CAMNT_0053112227 /DNA_START=23 /DNA_END=661 /DNA_ORIENTATION=+
MAQYGKPEYWEDRYQRDTEAFDWYQRYTGVKDIVTQYISPNHQILNIGCGNSRMSEEMYEERYEYVTNVDISFTVIKAMAEEYEGKCPNMHFKQMDVRSLQFDQGTFDCVVDKGTFDSILCGDGSGPNSDQTLNEIYRVLSPTGVYICISYGIPDTRESYFRNNAFDWELHTHKVAKPTISTSAIVSSEDKDPKNFHYIYVMRKTVGKKGDE